MPLYEYQCESCSQEFETLVRSAADVPRCPHCGGIDLARLFSVLAAARDSGARVFIADARSFLLRMRSQRLPNRNVRT